jgi:hypothetical protein
MVITSDVLMQTSGQDGADSKGLGDVCQLGRRPLVRLLGVPQYHLVRYRFETLDIFLALLLGGQYTAVPHSLPKWSNINSAGCLTTTLIDGWDDFLCMRHMTASFKISALLFVALLRHILTCFCA